MLRVRRGKMSVLVLSFQITKVRCLNSMSGKWSARGTRFLSWHSPYNVWVCHTSWGDHRETFQVRWHLPQGLESELMGLARDLLSHGTCADFMAAHHCTRGLHTHTHPYTTHTHTFLRVPEIRGRYFGRCATCFRVWRVREWGYQEMCPVVQHV